MLIFNYFFPNNEERWWEKIKINKEINKRQCTLINIVPVAIVMSIQNKNTVAAVVYLHGIEGEGIVK